MNPVRVMLVDDSAIIRRLLGSVLRTDAMITVVGQAADGRAALARLDEADPDVVVLDIEMPVMGGLEALEAIKARRPDLPVIMFSTLTEAGASATLEALTRGADDYVTKPSNTGSFARTAEQIRGELVPKIKGLRRRGRSAPPAAPSTAPPPAPATPPDPRPLTSRAQAHAAIMRQPVRLAAPRGGPPPELVTIGVSTGGPHALAHVIPRLPASFPVPVLVTQHMPAIFTRLLAERLDAQSALRVREATPGAAPVAGEVWLAPGGHHMLVRRASGGRLSLTLDDGPPVNSCKPAVDPMFDSAVTAVGGRVLGVVLTGMGSDGLDGCQRIASAGGRVIVQDEATSVVWGMPGIVAHAGLAERIVPLDGVAAALADLTRPTPRPVPVRSR